MRQIALLEHETITYQTYLLEGPAPYMFSVGGFSDGELTLTLMDGDAIEVVEQEPLTVGATVDVTAPADAAQLLVFPLELTESEEPILLQVSDMATGDGFGIEPGVIRDANGDPIETELSDATFMGGISFFPNGELPYRFELASLPAGASWRVSLSGFYQDAGAIEFGQRIEGTTLDGVTLSYTIASPVEEGQVVTLSSEAPVDGGVAIAILDANGESNTSGVFGTRYQEGNIDFNVAVTRMSGPPPYTLSVYNSAFGGADGEFLFAFTLEDGDQLGLNEVAVLVPGYSVAGTIPAAGESLSFVTLDVEPDTIITLDWGPKGWGTIFGIKDGTGAVVNPITDTYDADYAVFDLTGLEGPFTVPLLAGRYLSEGAEYTLTLAEGDQPIPFEEATPTTDTPDEAITSSGSESATETGECTISNSSDVNQRSGPGTDFERAGALAAGTSTSVDGQATGSDGLVWWRLGEGVWVRSDVVTESGNCEGVAVVQP